MNTISIVSSCFEVFDETLARTLLKFAATKTAPKRVHVYTIGDHHFPEVKIDAHSITKLPKGVSFLGTPYKNRKPCQTLLFFWNDDFSPMANSEHAQHFRVTKIKWNSA